MVTLSVTSASVTLDRAWRTIWHAGEPSWPHARQAPNQPYYLSSYKLKSEPSERARTPPPGNS